MAFRFRLCLALRLSAWLLATIIRRRQRRKDQTKMRSVIIILIVLSTTIESQSQQTIIENLIPSADADLPYEDLYENIAQLTVNKMDLNKASPDELGSLGILTQNQVDAIINYRKTNGDFLEVYELQSVPSLEPETIRSL